MSKSTTSQTDNPKSPKSKFKTILLLAVTILSIGFWYTAIYAPIESHEGEYALALDDPQFSNLTNIAILHHPSTASVSLEFDPTATLLFNASWQHIYTEEGAAEPLDMVVEYTLAENNTLLTIDIDDSTDEQAFDFMGMIWNRINIFECVIIINPVALMELYVNLEDVGVDIYAQETNFSTFNIEYETGHVDVYMDNVTIQNPVNIEGLSAGNDLYFNNVIFESNFSASTISGHQDLFISDVEFQNVSVDTVSGGIDFICDDSTALDVKISSATGHIDYVAENFILNDLTITTASAGIDVVGTMLEVGDVTLKTSTGHIEVMFQDVNTGELTLTTASAGIDLYIDDSVTSNVSATSATGHIDVYLNALEAQNIFVTDGTGGVSFNLLESEVADVSVHQTTGYANIELLESTVGEISISSTSGSTDFLLEGGILKGNITVDASTGHQDIELIDISLNHTLFVDLSTTTAGLDLYWSQEQVSVNLPVYVTLESTYGQIEAEIYTQYGDEGRFNWTMITDNDNSHIEIEASDY
ncbi:MAG: DUF4097 family beta strand repeat-containing protein [Promethearchaeota archaeon]